MEPIRPASFDEYATWYLEREVRKGNRDSIPQTPGDRLAEFNGGREKDKYRDWFPAGSWFLQRLQIPEDLETLIFLDTPQLRPWLTNTPERRPLLGDAAKDASTRHYFENNPRAAGQRRNYEDLKARRTELRGSDRLVIITPNTSEKSDCPSGTFYLHDGFGRALPYMMVILQGVKLSPVEALLGEECAGPQSRGRRDLSDRVLAGMRGPSPIAHGA